MKSLAHLTVLVALIFLTTPQLHAQRGGRPGGDRGDRGFGGRPSGGERGSFGGRPGGGERSGFGGCPGGDRGGFGGGRPSFGGGPGGSTRGGFGGGRPSFDTNGDGQIDKNEIANMPEGFRQAMESRGIKLQPGSVDQFRDSMRKQFEQKAREEGWSWGRREEDNRREENGESANRERYQPAAPFRPRERERVTVDLPPKYSELDLDFDGQVGLYEWITAKRESLEEFDEIDGNADGVLTPKELKFFDEITAASEAKVTSYKRDRVVLIDGKGTFTGKKAGDSTTTKSNMSAEERESTVKKGKSYFSQMDKNKNGKIDREEWESSKRIRPWFESSGIKLSSMSEDDFANNFLKAVELMKENQSKGKDRKDERREWKR